jgi:hypothetical protein
MPVGDTIVGVGSGVPSTVGVSVGVAFAVGVPVDVAVGVSVDGGGVAFAVGVPPPRTPHPASITTSARSTGARIRRSVTITRELRPPDL